MEWIQKEITLAPRSRGFHVVTSEILEQVPEMRRIERGLAHLFVLHTSASLTINENADPDVRADMESHFNAMVPEKAPYYEHTTEGPDDMPAHIKASLLGCGTLVPVTGGRFHLGTWQGVYLCEHRDRPRPRRVLVTVFGATT